MNLHDFIDHQQEGILYIVSTPIGNLEDITIRALKVLRKVDMIACEDTRKSLRLLNHFKIKKPLTSFFSGNQSYKGTKIIKLLKEGKNIALVSEAGTPGISDPGTSLIAAAIRNHINILPIGGVSAAIIALSNSGFDTSKFSFIGFLPRKKSKKRKILLNFKDRDETLILFESPHRIIELLQDLLELFGNREITLCREMTKLHEQTIHSSLEEILKSTDSINFRGEITLVVRGNNQP